MLEENSSSNYWSPVTDDLSSKAAIKMAGLPVLLVAFDAAFIALTLLVKSHSSAVIMGSFLTLSALLLIIAFRMRSGHAAYMPIVAVVYPAFLALVGWSSFSGASVAGQWPVQLVWIISNWVVPTLAAIFAFRGLRGWMWMRSHHVPMSF